MPWKRLLTLSAVAAASAVTCARPASIGRVRGEPSLRVGLSTTSSSIELRGEGGLEVRNANRIAFRTGGNRTVHMVSDGDRVRIPDGSGSGVYRVLTFRGRSGERTVTFNGSRYRGQVEVRSSRGVLTVVNVVGLESYLPSVVGAEMGRRGRNETAALRAQAVASRTYALKNRGKFASLGIDVMASVADQVYGGLETEYAGTVEAVGATRGQVLTYGGELISAFFHSTCGYSTAAPDEAFRNTSELPYLRPVSDRNGDGYYCDISPNFRWTVAWTQAELQRILDETLPATLGIDRSDAAGVRALRAYRTGRSGRVIELRIGVAAGEIPVTAPNIRSVLRTPEGRALGSTAVQFSTSGGSGGGGGGEGITFLASGAGWGHGVGMCQWGTVGRARAGQSYREILGHYFSGTRIERFY